MFRCWPLTLKGEFVQEIKELHERESVPMFVKLFYRRAEVPLMMKRSRIEMIIALCLYFFLLGSLSKSRHEANQLERLD